MFGTKRTLGQAFKDLFGMGTPLRDEQFDELEDVLIESDLGPTMAMKLGEQLRKQARDQRLQTVVELQEALAANMAPMLKVADLTPRDLNLNCYLFLGVNGVGKTTSIAKFAHHLKTGGYGPVVLAAGDTFRAAACHQLELHGQRLGIRTVSQGQGADSAAVIHDAVSSARSRSERVVLADTAGRLHNKAHLIKELEKVDKVVRSQMGQGTYQKVLVLDAGTGRNGVEQARVFHEAVGVDAVIVSKYDAQARGGMLVSICSDLGLGVAFLGTGESYENLLSFEPVSFARRLAGL